MYLFYLTADSNQRLQRFAWFVAEGFLAAAAANHLESKQTWKMRLYQSTVELPPYTNSELLLLCKIKFSIHNSVPDFCVKKQKTLSCFIAHLSLPDSKIALHHKEWGAIAPCSVVIAHLRQADNRMSHVLPVKEQVNGFNVCVSACSSHNVCSTLWTGLLSPSILSLQQTSRRQFRFTSYGFGRLTFASNSGTLLFAPSGKIIKTLLWFSHTLDYTLLIGLVFF